MMTTKFGGGVNITRDKNLIFKNDSNDEKMFYTINHYKKPKSREKLDQIFDSRNFMNQRKKTIDHGSKPL